MKFKLNEKLVVCDDGKWRPLSWNSRSVVGVVTKIKSRKQVRIRFEYGEIYELWFKLKKMKFRNYKDWQHDGGFLNFYTAVKYKVFQKEMEQ